MHADSFGSGELIGITFAPAVDAHIRHDEDVLQHKLQQLLQQQHEHEDELHDEEDDDDHRDDDAVIGVSLNASMR